MQLAFVPPSGSPVRQQYLAIKRQYPDAIVFFQLGDFYETFEDDARRVAEACDVVLTAREMGKGERVPMAGVPIHAADTYVARLVDRGYHIAICQQMEDAAVVKGSGIVRREVTRVITPGTLVDLPLLTGERSNFLAALVSDRRRVGFAYAEVSTGQFACTLLDGPESLDLARSEAWRLQAAECLLPDEATGTGMLPPQAAVTIDAGLFSAASAEATLCRHFGVASVAALGLEGRDLAVRAAAAIVSYLGRNQARAASALDHLDVYDARGYMILDPPTRDHLEIMRGAGHKRVGSLLYALDRTRTPMGARLLANWLGHPLLNAAQIEARLDRVQALLDATGALLDIQADLGRLPDLERLAGRAVQRLLSPREMVALAAGIDCAAEVRARVDRAGAPALQALITRLVVPTSLAEQIRDTVAIDPPSTFGEGVIRDGRVPELDELRTHTTHGRQWLLDLEARERTRTGMKNLKVGYNRVFGYYLEASAVALAQPLDYYREQEAGVKTLGELLLQLGYQRRQTLTSAERFVTPELREHEAQQAKAATRMAELERAAFDALAEQVAERAADLTRTAQALAELDVAASGAQIAREQRFTRPTIVPDPITEIVGGRHPVVEPVVGWDVYIPDDLHLMASTAARAPADGANTSEMVTPEAASRPAQVMVLTGPNMAGKTTYGRMALLVTLLAQCGFFVPAERACLGIADRIFLRSGAGDDIAGGQSTFMVEMTETAAILRAATPRSLAFFDEVGRGTSTFDGMALARAIVEFLAVPGRGCRTIFSTHYHELAAIEQEQPTVRNSQMEVRELRDQIAFTYRVIPGAADRSYGVHVAQLAGLPASVVSRAAEVLADLEARGTDNPTDGTSSRREARHTRAPLPDLILRVAELNPNEMTPLEALQALDALRREANALIGGRAADRTTGEYP